MTCYLLEGNGVTDPSNQALQTSMWVLVYIPYNTGSYIHFPHVGNSNLGKLLCDPSFYFIVSVHRLLIFHS